MKKKLIALLAAVAMVFSLAACGSTPDSVGTIGTVDITSGLYLLAQYDAYQKAADLATSDADACFRRRRGCTAPSTAPLS